MGPLPSIRTSVVSFADSAALAPPQAPSGVPPHPPHIRRHILGIIASSFVLFRDLPRDVLAALKSIL